MSEKKNKKYRPPPGAIAAAKKAIAWKEKYGDEVTAMTRVGWARAHHLPGTRRIPFCVLCLKINRINKMALSHGWDGAETPVLIGRKRLWLAPMITNFREIYLPDYRTENKDAFNQSRERFISKIRDVISEAAPTVRVIRERYTYSRSDIRALQRRADTHPDVLHFIHHTERGGKNIIDFKCAYLNNLWYFNAGGYSGYTSIENLTQPHDLSTINEFYERVIAPASKHTKFQGYNSKNHNHINIREVESYIPDMFILVALQVENDTAMKLKHIETDSMIRIACAVGKRMNLPVVVKKHPLGSSVGRVPVAVDTMIRESTIVVTTANIVHLLNRAKAVFVINSGVGFEAGMKLKPVITFGKNDYSPATLYNPSSINEIVEYVMTDQSDKIKTVLYNWWNASNIIDINDSNHLMKMESVLTYK